MKQFIRLYLIAFFVVSDFKIYAQPTNEDPDDGNIEGDGDVTPAAPINSKLFLLVIFAIYFAFYSYTRKVKKV
jgi:hypothetical protein